MVWEYRKALPRLSPEEEEGFMVKGRCSRAKKSHTRQSTGHRTASGSDGEAAGPLMHLQASLCDRGSLALTAPSVEETEAHYGQARRTQ